MSTDLLDPAAVKADFPLLEHLRPDVVHVLLDGRIVARGGAEVAERLERDGYDAFR